MEKEYRFKVKDFSTLSDVELFDELQSLIDSFDVTIAHKNRRIDQKFRIMALQSIKVYMLFQEFEVRCPGVMDETQHELTLKDILTHLNIKTNGPKG